MTIFDFIPVLSAIVGAVVGGKHFGWLGACAGLPLGFVLGFVLVRTFVYVFYALDNRSHSKREDASRSESDKQSTGR